MRDVMNYGKARGMALVKKYLPKLNPFQYVNVVGTLEEWELIRDKYGKTMIHRIDYPIGHAQVKQNAVQGTNGLMESIPELISTVRQQGDAGVVLIAQSFCPPPPRYLYAGGFNILFCVGDHVTIELVGRAFDGHELTQGLACHERYRLNWDDIPFVLNRAGLVRYSTLKSWATIGDYSIQRRERVRFLTTECHFPPDIVEASVPELLPLLDDEALRCLLDDVIIELRGQRFKLERDNLMMFGVQGNVVEIDGQMQIQPWEIFRPERWT